jgi:pimeloyl-ACP methyl ester carboxylesterase
MMSTTRTALLAALAVATGLALAVPAPPRAAAQAPALGTGGDGRGHVDVGGHRLYLECVGAGGPTVVLEAGGGNAHDTWGQVQPQLAALTRVCSYDRAGVGQSDPPPGVRPASALAAELDALLTAARVPGPYVLVAHSIGSHVVRLYAARHPDRVAGVVLVDGTAEDYAEGFLPLLAPAARENALRYVHGENPERLDIVASDAEVRAAPPPPPVPVALLTRTIREGQPVDEFWRGTQIDLARRLAASPHAFAPNSGHNIQRDQPELVLDATRVVVSRARATAGPRGLPRTGRAAGTSPFGVLVFAVALVALVAGLGRRRSRPAP